MMELMSPCGSPESFIAAIDAGADSVYLGIKKFNARKPAQNFTLFQLKQAIEYAHQRKKRVYLVLNIDVKSNEIKEIYQTLKTVIQLKMDAVIIKDYGLYYLIRKYFQNQVEIHFSTQASLESVPAVKMTRAMGFNRIVLARELVKDEIQQCSAVAGIETEIFVEGSMCFSISGRCLMSSWVGGRSGNRGACTAPCRMVWKKQDKSGNLFSMKDLSLFNSIDLLKETGVKALKIEGRLKNAGWVYLATSLYRQALDGTLDDHAKKSLLEELRSYSARETGTGHLTGHQEVIGDNQAWDNLQKPKQKIVQFDLSIFHEKNELVIIIENDLLTIDVIHNQMKSKISLKLPANPKKAKLYSINSIRTDFDHSFPLNHFECSHEIFLSSSQLNKISGQIIEEYNGLVKKEEELLDLTPDESEYFEKVLQVKEKSQILGTPPDRLIINSGSIGSVSEKYDFLKTIVVMMDAEIPFGKMEYLKKNYQVIIGLPEMIYESDIAWVQNQINEALKNGYQEFEANSLSGIYLLKDLDIKRHLGQGMALMNPLAIHPFKEMGYLSFYGSHELDKSGMGLLALLSEKELGMVVYGYLPLFISRSEPTSHFESRKYQDKFTQIKSFQIRDTVYFASMQPFNLCSPDIIKDKIHFDFLSADLRFSPDIRNDLEILSGEKKREPSLFNYNRKLV